MTLTGTFGGEGKKTEEGDKVQTCFLYQTNQREKVKSLALTFARAHYRPRVESVRSYLTLKQT